MTTDWYKYIAQWKLVVPPIMVHGVGPCFSVAMSSHMLFLEVSLSLYIYWGISLLHSLWCGCSWQRDLLWLKGAPSSSFLPGWTLLPLKIVYPDGCPFPLLHTSRQCTHKCSPYKVLVHQPCILPWGPLIPRVCQHPLEGQKGFVAMASTPSMISVTTSSQRRRILQQRSIVWTRLGVSVDTLSGHSGEWGRAWIRDSRKEERERRRKRMVTGTPRPQWPFPTSKGFWKPELDVSQSCCNNGHEIPLDTQRGCW